MTRYPSPHDIVHIRDRRFLFAPGGLEISRDAQVAAAGSVADDDPGCWVVVRRAAAGHGAVSIGIRGRDRSQRYAAEAPLDQVSRVVSPEMVPRTLAGTRSALPAFRALRSIGGDEFLRFRSGWGPTGSVGFELVTAWFAVSETSDLDILISCPAPLDIDEAARFLERIATYECRIDVQIDAPAGAFALSEWVRENGKRVAVRTGSGPVLSHNPWATQP